MKYISVPVNAAAMERLDFDTCHPNDLLEVTFNEVEYAKLWQSGIIKEINDRLDVCIDDYEDEKLIGIENLVILKELVEDFLLADKNNMSLYKLKSQIDNAITFKTGIFFYF